MWANPGRFAAQPGNRPSLGQIVAGGHFGDHEACPESGGKPPEGTVVIIAQIATVIYYAFFFVVLPFLPKIEKTVPLSGSPDRVVIENLQGYVHATASGGSNVRIKAHKIIRAETDADLAEIIGDQLELGVARAGIDQSVEQAGEVAQAAGVKTLVLNHFVPGDDSVPEDVWREQASKAFSGEIIVGKDLLKV